MRLTHESIRTSCGKRYELFHEGILEGNVGQVERSLKTYQNWMVNLTVQHCFWAMKEAIILNREGIVLLLLNYAEKVYEAEIIATQIENWKILVFAIGQNHVSIVKRLIRKVTFDDSLLWIAFQEGRAEIAEELIAAGYSPQIVLSGDHRFFRSRYLGESHKEVWKVLLPHWKAEDVLQSPMVFSYICKLSGKDILQLMGDLGIDFCPSILSCHSAAITCMKVALYYSDLNTVQFLFDQDFDLNACLDSKPLLHHLIVQYEYERNAAATHALILNALKRGANPLLSNSDNENFVDICVDVLNCSDNDIERPEFVKILKLLVRMGFRIPDKKIDSICAEDDDVKLSEMLTENSFIPSLRSRCRSEIRMAMGSRVTRFMDNLEYPQALKDFVLLDDIDFEDFKYKKTSMFSYSGRSDDADD